MVEPRIPSSPSLYVAELAERSDGEVVRLEDEESRHARSLRLDAGAAVVLTNGRGTRKAGRLGPAAERSREVVVGPALPASEPLPVELAIAVGNRTHTLWLVEKAAEFGVRRLSPIETERSRSVSDGGRSAGFWSKAGRRALAAVKQSGGAWLPEITPVEDLQAWLSRVRSSGSHAVVLDMAGEPLRSLLPSPPTPVVLLVGPEGGLTGSELEACAEAGFRFGRLGSTVLRFETAAVAALAVVAQEREVAGVSPGKPEGEST
jgi:16S rRNA (uracil1498-N3)-methyltransferase